MNIKCPHCGTEYEVEKKDMYHYTKCEVCGKGFVAGATTSLLTGDRSVASKKDELLNGASDDSRQGASQHPIIQVKTHKTGQANTKTSFQNSTSQASRPSSTVKPTTTDRTTAREIPLPAASQEAAPQNTIKTVGIWAAIAVLGFIVVVTIISAAFLAYTFGGRCHLIGEGIERIERDVNQRMVRMEEELKKSSDVVLETVAKEQEGRFSALKERMENVNDNVRRDLDDLEDRIVAAEQQVQKSLSSTESLTAGVDDLLKQLDELKAQIEGIATQKRPSEMPRRVAPPPEKSATTSDENLAEHRKKYNENLSEIAELRQKNPACILKDDVGTKDIRNIDTRMATKADRRYCRKDKIVYVRNRFFCTKCDKEEYDPCNVSAKKGFPEWKKFRDAVDETTRIVNRIDELYRENAALKRDDG